MNSAQEQAGARQHILLLLRQGFRTDWPAKVPTSDYLLTLVDEGTAQTLYEELLSDRRSTDRKDEDLIITGDDEPADYDALLKMSPAELAAWMENELRRIREKYHGTSESAASLGDHQEEGIVITGDAELPDYDAIMKMTPQERHKAYLEDLRKIKEKYQQPSHPSRDNNPPS